MPGKMRIRPVPRNKKLLFRTRFARAVSNPKFVRRTATVASLAFLSIFGPRHAAQAQEARPDSNKAKFVPGLVDYRHPLASGFNATTFLVTEKVPIFLDFTKAEGGKGTNIWGLGLAGKGNVGVHLIYQNELQAKGVPDFLNFGVKGKIGPAVAGLSVSGQKGQKPIYEPGVKSGFSWPDSKSGGAMQIRKTFSPGGSPGPVVVSINSWREIGASKLTAFLGGNAQGQGKLAGGISLDQNTRAFDVSIGPGNAHGVALVHETGKNTYLSFIYTGGDKKAFTVEIFKLF